MRLRRKLSCRSDIGQRALSVALSPGAAEHEITSTGGEVRVSAWRVGPFYPKIGPRGKPETRRSVTLAVSSIDDQIAHLTKLGIDTGERSSGEKVKTLMITDPDGNDIAFAEAIDPRMAQ